MIVGGGEQMIRESRFVLSLGRFCLFSSFVYNGWTNGALQSKLIDGGNECKGLEDVVGSVRGFLAANK